MTEYHTVKHIDNSRLVRPMAPARLQDFWRRVAVGGAMAACLLFYAWQHFECIQLQYQVEHLARSACAVRATESAIARGSGDPAGRRAAWIALRATNLGLTISVPGQVTPAGRTERRGAGSGARSGAAPAALNFLATRACHEVLGRKIFRGLLLGPAPAT